jgi:hypothetical protein
MTTTNNQTAAERYRDILASRRPTYTITSPSGMEWELREVSVQDYVLANQLPFQIASKVAQLVKAGASEGAALESLPAEEQLEWLLFVQKLVKDSVISPKIVEHATKPDEIDFVLQEDFEFLAAEVLGGDAVSRTASFRRGSRPSAVDSTNSKKRRSKT